MKTIIEIALEECANLSIAEAKRIFDQVGDKDAYAIREAVLKIKFNVP